MRIKRTSMNLDLDLVGEARELLGTNGTTDTVHRALREVISLEKRRRLAAWDLGGMTLEDLKELRRPRFFDPESD
jgi:Arc/MetJ family transcription regulator